MNVFEIAVNSVWYTLVSLSVFIVLMAYIKPSVIDWIISIPYVSRFETNLGPECLKDQSVHYATFHTNLANVISHNSFMLDAICWCFIAGYFSIHWLGIAVLLLSIQACSFKIPTLVASLCIMWMLIFASVVKVYENFSDKRDDIYFYSKFFLCLASMFRMATHSLEPCPPGIMNADKFTDDSIVHHFLTSPHNIPTLYLIMTTVLGWAAEFQAAWPYRLVNSWMFISLDSLGVLQHSNDKMSGDVSWTECKQIAQQVLETGTYQAPPSTPSTSSA